jgi:hypothetical protein
MQFDRNTPTEMERLANKFGFDIQYRPTAGGFFALLTMEQVAELRCEDAVASIEFNELVVLP